jgi:hypothetical protein
MPIADWEIFFQTPACFTFLAVQRRRSSFRQTAVLHAVFDALTEESRGELD